LIDPALARIDIGVSHSRGTGDCVDYSTAGHTQHRRENTQIPRARLLLLPPAPQGAQTTVTKTAHWSRDMPSRFVGRPSGSRRLGASERDIDGVLEYSVKSSSCKAQRPETAVVVLQLLGATGSWHSSSWDAVCSSFQVTQQLKPPAATRLWYLAVMPWPCTSRPKGESTLPRNL